MIAVRRSPASLSTNPISREVSGFLAASARIAQRPNAAPSAGGLDLVGLYPALFAPPTQPGSGAAFGRAIWSAGAAALAVMLEAARH